MRINVDYVSLHTSFDLLYIPRDLFISETTIQYNNENSSVASVLEE